MAGRGPAPKAPEERRRTNKPPPLEELPVEGYAGDYPKLPRTYRIMLIGQRRPKSHNQQFLAATRNWYETWARSPMAVEFTGVDWRRLQMIAPLVDGYERNPSKAVLAEIRLQEQGFGGTPMDRRRMGFKIARSSEEPVAKPSKRSTSRRARLQVVK